MAIDIKKLAALAAETEDQTVAPAGGDFVYEIPVAGVTVGRFIQYIELGKQPQKPFQGKDKPPAEEVHLTFELLHPKKNIHTYQDAEGNDKVRTDKITLKLAKKLGDKASYKKLFDKMRYGRDIKHMAQMLGEGFIITIIHNADAKDEKKIYANIRDDAGEWLIRPPFQIDPIEGTKTNVPIGEPISDLKIFLFENPDQEQWDSIFVDGSKTVKDAAGKETEQSRNWFQEKIMSATNYKGSPLHQMLGGVELSELPMSEDEELMIPEEDTPKAETPAETKKSPAATESAEDALAAIGLGDLS